MKKLTLKDLQEKIWYRLLKVIFVSFFVLAEVFAVALVFNDNGYDYKETLITCSNEKTYNAHNEGLRIASTYISSRQDAVNFCEEVIQKETENYSSLPATERMELMEKASSPIIELKIKYEIKTQMLRVLFWTPIVMGIFELIRRIFYYVILGTFRPKNS